MRRNLRTDSLSPGRRNYPRTYFDEGRVISMAQTAVRQMYMDGRQFLEISQAGVGNR